MKVLKCRDVGFDCQAVVRAASADEVLQQAADHARQAHQVVVTPAIAAKVRDAIRDE